MALEYFSAKLSLDYTKLLETSNDYDVIIEIGERERSNGNIKSIFTLNNEEEENFKIFKAHSIILKTRCKYFEAALSHDWVKMDNDDKIILKNPNIYPKTFSIILKYIYDGSISLEYLSPSDIIILLISSDELAIEELIGYIQKYLITYHSKYIQENIHQILNLSYNHSSYKDIQSFCIEKLIMNNPILLFNSINFFYLYEEILLELLERDDFNKFNEIDMWNFIIKWGIYQSNDQLSILDHNDEEWLLNLELKDLIDYLINTCSWTTKEFNILGKILKNLLTKIRFIEFLKVDFIKYITPFKEIFNNEFYDQLQDHFYSFPNNLLPPPPFKSLPFDDLDPIKYYTLNNNDNNNNNNNNNNIISNNNFPKKIITLKPPRRRLNSEIITNYHIKVITNWLDHKDNNISPLSSHCSSSSIISQFTLTPTTTTFLTTSYAIPTNGHPSSLLKPPYKFTLLYRASRDSFDLYNLHRILDNKLNIMIIAKISGTNELVGGFNPVGWNNSNKSHPDSINSFIFSFRDNNSSSTCSNNNSPPLIPRLSRLKRELIDKTVFNSKTGFISFGGGSDLRIGGILNKRTGYTKAEYYENRIRDIHGTFYIDDYEVFQIS
ncbi:hypothetical protein RhiirA5_411792 [Rhizophagus irregularis]|uniref:Kelch-like protein 17 n=2 Tax=Rhizophagus irregularis TaxID=588596 RepID=A0A2N0Q055_9GLOM|nr:hypothetical protein RirG_225320 [Rhizophagus irregularis DAOM 197198w]PKC12472.1 hypothetical protein RhiirA5_411792 [Rhizophagus irregularis]UZO07789.1 hypothetical protein OCT59_028064 [Rhizophagus irregularis]CAB4473351.1 unnamed protein product [Rhizophagus irregularis]CAB5205526.1 unnamed protein product [Rhizophagus irregularis]